MDEKNQVRTSAIMVSGLIQRLRMKYEEIRAASRLTVNIYNKIL